MIAVVDRVDARALQDGSRAGSRQTGQLKFNSEASHWKSPWFALNQ